MPSPAPSKRIHTPLDVALFKSSVSYQTLKTHLLQIVHIVQGVSCPAGSLDAMVVTREQGTDHKVSTEARRGPFNLPPPHSPSPGPLPTSSSPYQPGAKAVITILQTLRSWIKEIPPLQVPTRFGNPSCKVWHARVTADLPSLINSHFGPESDLTRELSYYLGASFGSEVRLDYGTGHELSFLGFVVGLCSHGLLVFSPQTPPYPPTDLALEILAMFGAYYDLVRDLIITYTLEPAGSHGVWGLDDHFHLIYLLGASQFLPSEMSKISPSLPALLGLRPSQVFTAPVLNSRVVEQNLFVNAVSFVKKVKSGPFNEHSPLLYDLSSVPSWAKIVKGLLRMYDVEVLGKFPVAQHFYFGTVLYPWADREGVPLREPVVDAEGGDAPVPTSRPFGGSQRPADLRTGTQSPPGVNLPKHTPAPWPRGALSGLSSSQRGAGSSVTRSYAR